MQMLLAFHRQGSKMSTEKEKKKKKLSKAYPLPRKKQHHGKYVLLIFLRGDHYLLNLQEMFP